MKPLILAAYLLTTTLAYADCTGPQPQADCYPADGQARPVAPSSVQGVDEVANSALAAQVLCEQSVKDWQEWFRRALVAFMQTKAKCGRKCSSMRVEGL